MDEVRAFREQTGLAWKEQEYMACPQCGAPKLSAGRDGEKLMAFCWHCYTRFGGNRATSPSPFTVKEGWRAPSKVRPASVQAVKEMVIQLKAITVSAKVEREVAARLTTKKNSKAAKPGRR